MITDGVALIYNRVSTRFTVGRDFRNLGVYNRRYIRGTTNWSQHSWGNAWDIGVVGLWVPWVGWGKGSDGQKKLDEIYNYLISLRNSGVPVGTILWRRRDHYNHIHVEAVPKKMGIPPLPSGVPDEDEEMLKEIVKDWQAMLVANGFTDKDGNPLKVDGVWGPKTKHAFNQMVQAAGKAGPHSHKVTIV